jgi:hypothetical protein
MTHHSVDQSVGSVLIDLVSHPVRRLVRRWNWKSAVLSSGFRSTIFFLTNLSAGIDAAVAAMVTELTFRGVTAGFYGALTQSFRHATPAWLATLTVMVLLPAATHTVELLVHWLRGTERLQASVLASCVFTAVSTTFNLFAMRRGALIVGDGRQSLANDLLNMPRLIAAFVVTIALVVLTGLRRLAGWRMKAPRQRLSTPRPPALRP